MLWLLLLLLLLLRGWSVQGRSHLPGASRRGAGRGRGRPSRGASTWRRPPHQRRLRGNRGPTNDVGAVPLPAPHPAVRGCVPRTGTLGGGHRGGGGLGLALLLHPKHLPLLLQQGTLLGL